MMDWKHLVLGSHHQVWRWRNGPRPPVICCSPDITSQTTRCCSSIPAPDHIQVAGISCLLAPCPRLRGDGIALDADTANSSPRSDLRITWPCSTELNGWGSEAVSRYGGARYAQYVPADRQRRIVARPVDALNWRRSSETSCTSSLPFITLSSDGRCPGDREQTEYAGPEPLMAAMDRAGSQ